MEATACVNENFDDTLESLRCFFTDSEYFYETVNGTQRLTIILDEAKQISAELHKEMESMTYVRHVTSSNMYYLSPSYPIVVKLRSILSPRKGEKHIGILSLQKSLAEIGAKLNIGYLKSKAKIVPEVMASDEKLRYFPGARARILPCPPSHITCNKIWDTSDMQLDSLKSMCLLNEENEDDEGRKRHVIPLCIFARKLVRPVRELPEKIPCGIFALPYQFDKSSHSYNEAKKQGLIPYNYKIQQLRNLGPGSQLLVQCAINSHYKALWNRSKNAFKAGELASGTYEVIGFFLESSERMSLHVSIIDELIIPLEGRLFESDVNEGHLIFDPKLYKDIADYSDDVECNSEKRGCDESVPGYSKRVKSQ